MSLLAFCCSCILSTTQRVRSFCWFWFEVIPSLHHRLVVTPLWAVESNVQTTPDMWNRGCKWNWLHLRIHAWLVLLYLRVYGTYIEQHSRQSYSDTNIITFPQLINTLYRVFGRQLSNVNYLFCRQMHSVRWSLINPEACRWA